VSLKSFHVFFISLAVLVTLFFGTWLFVTVDAGGAELRFIGGGVSYVAGVGLIVYMRYFLRKVRHFRSTSSDKEAFT